MQVEIFTSYDQKWPFDLMGAACRFYIIGGGDYVKKREGQRYV